MWFSMQASFHVLMDSLTRAATFARIGNAHKDAGKYHLASMYYNDAAVAIMNARAGSTMQ